MAIERQSSSQVAAIVIRVNALMRQHVDEHGNIEMTKVAEAMGWTLPELQDFRREYKDLLNYERQKWRAPIPQIKPPSDMEVLSGAPDLPVAPTEEEMGIIIERAESTFMSDFKRCGFTEQEANESDALRQFNNNHFKSVVDLSSATVMRTEVKLGMQQAVINARLETVRRKIAECEDVQTVEREKWLHEESLLMRQLVDSAEAIRGLAEVHFKGAAIVALASQRSRNNQGNAGVNLGKPKFRPMTVAPEPTPQ